MFGQNFILAKNGCRLRKSLRKLSFTNFSIFEPLEKCSTLRGWGIQKSSPTLKTGPLLKKNFLLQGVDVFPHVKASLDNCKGPYRSIFSVLISLPFFFQKIVGVGLPLGGAHSRRAVSPLATPTLDGSSRNFSRKTAKKRLEEKNLIRIALINITRPGSTSKYLAHKMWP